MGRRLFADRSREYGIEVSCVNEGAEPVEVICARVACDGRRSGVRATPRVLPPAVRRSQRWRAPRG